MPPYLDFIITPSLSALNQWVPTGPVVIPTGKPPTIPDRKPDDRNCRALFRVLLQSSHVHTSFYCFDHVT